MDTIDIEENLVIVTLISITAELDDVAMRGTVILIADGYLGIKRLLAMLGDELIISLLQELTHVLVLLFILTHADDLTEILVGHLHDKVTTLGHSGRTDHHLITGCFISSQLNGIADLVQRLSVDQTNTVLTLTSGVDLGSNILLGSISGNMLLHTHKALTDSLTGIGSIRHGNIDIQGGITGH